MSQSPLVHYFLFLHDPNAHSLKIRMVIEQAQVKQQLIMPAWIMGSYMLRDYAKHVLDITVCDDNGAIEVTKHDLHTWECHNRNVGKLTVTYTVYAFDSSVRGTYFNTDRAFINGPCVFLAPVGKLDKEMRLTVAEPESPIQRNWQLATSLPRLSGDRGQYGCFVVSDYTELLDHPIELGQFEQHDFDVLGLPHSLVITGQTLGSTQVLLQAVQKICQYEIEFFGSKPLSDRYSFLLAVDHDGYGGLEHRNSTALLCKRTDFPKVAGDDRKDYHRLLGLFSHEYFHQWWVKQVMPQAFKKQSLTAPNFSNQLWVFEGFTAYYDELILVRSGCITPEQYCLMLEDNLTRYAQNQGKSYQTVAQSSYDAWIKLYQPNENAANSMVSYYNKGAWIALCLDVAIRRETQNQRSLDDCVRYFYTHYQEVGTEDDAVMRWVAEFVSADLAKKLEQWVMTTVELPIADSLQYLGLNLHWQSNEKIKSDLAFFGAKLQTNVSRLIIKQVLNGSAAEVAGLQAKDELVAINDVSIRSQNLQTLVSFCPPEKEIKIHFFRDHLLIVTTLTPQVVPEQKAVISIPEQGMNAICQAWLELEETIYAET